MPDYSLLRSRMVDNQLRTFDVTDLRVQRAFATVPRERFVPPASRPIAYSDTEIPLDEAAAGQGRGMMRPAPLARMIQTLEIGPEDVALVVGAGMGYSTAIMARLANSVIALESDEALADRATAELEELGIDNVAVVAGPLSEGYPSDAPYDAILVDGAIETGLEPLTEQLKDGGRLAVVEGLGLAGKARLYVRSGDVVSGWPQFNAAAPLLPGFEKPEEFVF